MPGYSPLLWALCCVCEPSRPGSSRRAFRRIGRDDSSQARDHRPRELTGLPHLVELAVPPGGFRSVFPEIDTDRRIPVRRGRSRHEAEQSYIRFCFPDAATADAFRNRFGGECLTYAPEKPKPRTSATSG